MLTLYGFGPMGNSLKPMLALWEKGLAFEDRRLSMAAFDQHQDWYKAINPRGLVPSLIHDGHVIIESTVICEYLDDAFPAVPLRPSDPVQRAQMRVWTKWVDEHFCWCVSTIAWERTVSKMARALSEADFAAQLERIPDMERRRKWQDARSGLPQAVLDDETAKIERAVAHLEQRLEKAEWLVDYDYSLADICAFAIAANMPAGFPDMVNARRSPGLLRWIEAMRTREAYVRMIAERGDHAFSGYQPAAGGGQ